MNACERVSAALAEDLLREKKILFVDDSQVDREMFERSARLFHCRVDYAPDAECGERMAGQESYDLLLIDIGLPGMDGADLFIKLRAAGIRTPSVMFTGVLRDEPAARISSSGCCFFARKPSCFTWQYISEMLLQSGIRLKGSPENQPIEHPEI